MAKDPGSEFSNDESSRILEDKNRDYSKSWFGHPRGLATLFFTEMWERFSYYGMRGILFLFMTAAVVEGGMGLDERMAGAVYGLYTAMVYLLALPGGWVADKLWGQRKSVFVGGSIIALGHFSMAVPLLGLPDELFFYIGLALIVIGTGLLKPNVSTMVGDLYPEGGARRDAGFSIFYMGINIGAFLGPIVCGFLGESVNWHLGFSAAGFGMLLGLIQYKMGGKFLGEAGTLNTGEEKAIINKRARNFYLTLAGVGGAIFVFSLLAIMGTIQVTLPEIASWLGTGIVLLTIVFFAFLTLGTPMAVITVVIAIIGYLIGYYFLIPMPSVQDYLVESGLEATQVNSIVAIGLAMIFFIFSNLIKLASKGSTVSIEKRRIMVIFWLFLLAALFWAGFEQAGTSMNLFAQDLTDRDIFGWIMPASWLQSINPIFIIIFAPIFGWLWTWLASRNANPSIPVKFALGLLGLSAGFFVLAWGAANASNENLVSPAWLIVTYFLHTVGELCLSPVGLSSITKLAPRGRVGQMMGIWFIAASLGNLFAGLVAGQLESLAPSVLFWNLAMVIGIGGIVAMLLSPGVRRLMGNIE